MVIKMKYEIFKEYSKQSEPNKYEKKCIWETAIGLQKVDNLDSSEYLIEIAKKHIDGNISLDYANDLINSYYVEKNESMDRTEEADKVSLRIVELLSNKAFNFSIIQYISIHKYLFNGIFDYAGKIRDYNITKKEWVLNGDTVIYGNAFDLYETLEYDLNQEKKYNYQNKSIEEIIKHIAEFTAGLWQIHLFGEGNTRTTAVFLIKYLNKLGFDVTNDIFANNSWYFRNALVRANYNNYKLNINETTYYLELFLRNLLLNENNKLSNRELHIDYKENLDNKLSECELKVLKLLNDNPKITLDEVSIKMNKSLRTVKSIVKQLTEKELVKRIDGKKYGSWQVIFPQLSGAKN